MTTPIGQSGSDTKTYDTKIEAKSKADSTSIEAQENAPLEQGPASLDMPDGKLRNGETQTEAEKSQAEANEALEAAIWSDIGADNAVRTVKKEIKKQIAEQTRKARAQEQNELVTELYEAGVSMSGTEEESEDLAGPDSGKKASEKSSPIKQATQFSSSTPDEAENLGEDLDSKKAKLSGGFSDNQTLNLEETIN